MKSVKIGSFIALSGLSATALYAAGPTDIVVSDSYLNTAMGTNALTGLVTPGKLCSPYPLVLSQSATYASGCFNTAAGAYALASNTVGYLNTAFGADALKGTNSGAFNTAVGALAMTDLTAGTNNTAVGAAALFFNSGSYNTATGSYALFNNSNGVNNTAVGASALTANSTGNNNTAVGNAAMLLGTTGAYNTALGSYALNKNTTGTNLTAVGFAALYSNNTPITSGNPTAAANMTAIGSYALFHNTTGTGNNAQGFQAMFSNTTGNNNSAIGQGALYSNTTGYGNEAIGLTALQNLSSGIRNTAVGNNAGLNLITGNYNTYIGWGSNGSSTVVSSTENYVTRIGVTYQDPGVNGSPTTYISGIFNSAVPGGIPVVVNSLGQLGFAGSSERFKTDITPLAPVTGKLTELRPVSFHLKSDPTGVIQYGLIAEEVDKVYPELVIRDKDGKIQGVRYDELAPMLLSEMQKQQQVNAEQSAKIASLEQQHEDMKKQLADLNDLKQQLNAALSELKANQAVVAQR